MAFAWRFCGLVIIDVQSSLPYNSPAPFPPFVGKGIGKDADMSKLFEVTEINGMQLGNRFVRSATYEVMAAEDGGCSPRLVAYMNQLAEGGVGLIITSHAYVRPDGQAGPRQIGDV